MSPPTTIDWSKYEAQAPPAAANQIDWSKYEGQGSGTGKTSEDKSFLERAATQPSKFSYANPLHYFDTLGKGMAEGLEMLGHPVDTAEKIYQTAMAPHPMDFSDASNAPLLDQVKQGADTLMEGYGQQATMGAAGKVIAPVLSKGAEILSEQAKTATQKAVQAAQNVTPKQVAQGVGATGGALAGKGVLSPVLAGYGLKLGKVAELILGKERANSPIFKQPDLSLDDITDALADTIAQDRQRFSEQQASGLGKLPQTGAKPASQTGEALATKPVSVGSPEPPTAGGKAANSPRFTVQDRAAARSLLQDALSQSTKDIVDQALPGTADAATKLRAQSQVDLALKQGDIAGAEAAIKQANPAWTPKDRLPVPSTDEIRARIQAQNQAPKGFADVFEDNQILDAMRYDLNRHGWSAESEARREFIARNSTGMTKGELAQQAGMVGAEPKPVKLTKTPGVNTNAGTPATDDLTNLLQQSLDAVKKRQQQK